MVSATSAGIWPGHSALEAIRISLGELGDPHLPSLPLLPGSGLGAEALGRTAALLAEMPVEQQPYGWRLTPRPGADLRRASGWLTSDINALADAVGELSAPPPQLKLSFTGPLSLSAGLYLPLGERVLADSGARKETAESLAEGVKGFLGAVRRASPGSRLIIEVYEPEALRVLNGEIPTVSGFQRLRRLTAAEARRFWSDLLDSLRGAGVEEVVLHSSPGTLRLAEEAGFDAVMLPVSVIDRNDWESLAAWADTGRGVLLGASGSGGVAEASRSLWRSFREIGLDSRQDSVRIVEMQTSARSSVAEAREALSRITAIAEAVTELAWD